MKKKETKKFLLAVTLSILTLSGNAFAADVADWGSLKSNLENGQSATLTKSIDAGNQYIDMWGVNNSVSLNLNNNSINGTTLGTSALSPGFGEFSILDGTIQNFVNNGSYASEWGIAAMLGGALLNNGSNSNVSNVVFNSNQAPFGGAVANLKAIDNTKPASQNTQITVTSTDTNYTGNKAQLGGAIFNLTTRMSGDNFSIEQGEYAKNAIVNINAENSDVTFSGNSATTAGGAIFNMGTVNIEAAEGKKVEFATASDDIYNNNELNLVSGDITINSSISDKNINLSQYGLGTFGGKGVTNVQNGANVIANAIDQNSLNIANGGTLTTNVNGLVIDNAISNNGTLNLNGNQSQWDFNNPLNNVDVLNENIEGNGVTNFVSGNTQVSSNIGTEININGEETNVIVSNNNQGTITLGQSGKNITNTNGVLGIDKNVTLAGNLITGAGSETEILSAGSITSAVTNNGTLGIFDGTLGYDVSGNGMVVVGGELTNNAQITADSIEIDGASTVLGQNYTGNLITNASNVTTTNGIVNNSLLTFTGGTNANSISGDGKTTITGDVTNNASIAQAIDIQTGTLITSADNIGGAVTNAGTVELTGGNLAQVITGGNINITQDLISSADNFKGAIVNTAELTLTGGELTQNIAAGGGSVNITGDVSNSASIAQDIKISNGTLTSSADNITGAVENTGTYNVEGGTIASAISGNGDVNLSGNVISNANNTVTGNVTVAEGATLSKGVSGNLFSDAAALNLENGATLSLADGTVDTTTSIDNLAIAQGSTAKLELDWGDLLNTANSDAVAGNIELSKVDLTTKSDDTPFTVSSTLQDKISLSSDIELVADEDSNYVNYDATTGQFNADKLTLNDAIAQGDANGVYQMTADESLSAGLGTLQGSDNTLSVNGGGYSIIGNDNEGVTVNDGQTLNLTNIKEIGGFKDSTAVTNNGTVNLSNVALNDKVAGSGDLNVNGDTTFNNAVSGNTLNLNSGVLALGQAADISGANAFVVNGGALNLQNNAIQNTNLGNVTLNSDLDLRLDGNFAQQQIDTITANSFTDNGNHINISNILITEPTTEKSFSISPLGTGMDDSVRTALAGAIQYTGGEIAYSPIYKYTASYDPDSAMLKFGLVGGGGGGSTGYESFNPAIMASPVAAQLGGYLVQLNSYDNAFRNMDMYMLMTKEQRQAMKLRNRYASTDRNLVYDPVISQYENKAGWFRPFATFENVHLDNGPRVSNVAYGSYFGADSELYDLGHGWDGMWSVYAGYNGSHQAYDGIGIYQNGGTVGAVGMAYKGNYFAGLTANIGASAGEANSMFGREDFTMLMSGVAAKTGYNWELAKGKFIIQPSMLMSYSFVNTFDYHNAAGVGINSDPLHAIQLEPGLKFIGNLKNGWQPYLGVSVVWNIMDNTQFRANDVSLPSLSVDPYVRYGVGVRKAWGERFTGFLQAYFTNGGRNGVGLMAGFRWTVGKNDTTGYHAQNNTPEKLKTQVSLKSMK